MKRLYEVSLEVNMYVMAESAEEAETLAEDECAEEEIRAGNGCAFAWAVEAGHKPKHGWGPNSLVYGAGDTETKLGDAIEALEKP